MKKTGIALSVVAVLIFLVMSGCQAEPSTVTVNTTTTATKSTTVTQTMVSTVTATSTITSTITSTQTMASTTSSTTSTTTTSSGEAVATSPDGKLQIIEAEYLNLTVTDNQVRGVVKNVSDETLSAKITVEFLNSGGAAMQTKIAVINDLAPGEERSFIIDAELSLTPFAGFNIAVEIWQ